VTDARTRYAADAASMSGGVDAMPMIVRRIERATRRNDRSKIGNTMQHLVGRGHLVFAIGMIGFGVLSFVFAEPMSGLAPLPAWLPGHAIWAYLSGGVLLATGAAILIGRQARFAAIALSAMLLLWLLLLHLPKLAGDVRNGGEWTCAFETLALCGAAWILAASLSTDAGTSARLDLARLDHVVHRMAWLGRYSFALSLPAFGILHFIYADYVASVIPGWIPAHVFWAYFTGAAHFAAGVAILVNVKARLAATLAGVMYGCWVLILHIPRALAAQHSRAEWTSLFVATALTGAAWLVANSLRDHGSAASPAGDMPPKAAAVVRSVRDTA
jgi:uncharacterized membrane protein